MTVRKAPVSLALCIACLPACSDPIIGDWEGREPVGNQYNAMEIDDDLEGTARIYFFASDGGLYYGDFDVDVDVRDKGDRYDLDMRCVGNCASFNFTMRCRMRGDDDRLRCDGRGGGWETYVFEWERD